LAHSGNHLTSCISNIRLQNASGILSPVQVPMADQSNEVFLSFPSIVKVNSATLLTLAVFNSARG
ncbi:hypothetical protein L9F63_005477, partial [Diploptera punctata]